MIWRDRKSEALPSTVNPAEIMRFAAMSEDWWNPDGPFATLHRLNPVRLAFIRQQVARHFDRPAESDLPFAGLRVLDIGCGGGLLSEPIAFWGGEVLGIDASAKLTEVARLHAALVGAPVAYRHALAEDLVADGERFDVIVNTEVVEHVANVEPFLAACCAMVRPGGLMIVATLNRTIKSLLFAKIGGEYLLNLLPCGTHDWRRFIRPDELSGLLGRYGLVTDAVVGVSYHPLFGRFRLGTDTGVNYMAVAGRPKLRLAASQ